MISYIFDFRGDGGPWGHLLSSFGGLKNIFVGNHFAITVFQKISTDILTIIRIIIASSSVWTVALTQKKTPVYIK